MTAAELRRCAIACAALIVIYFAIPLHPNDSPVTLAIRITVSLLAIAAVVTMVRRQLLRQVGQPGAPLSGLVTAIVAGVVLFALIDYMLAIYGDGEFVGLNTRVDALYYALTTLFTIGFGDISAQGQAARTLLCIQMLFNVIVLATAGSVFLRQIGVRVKRSKNDRVDT